MIKLPETPAEVAEFIDNNFLSRMPATLCAADNSYTPSHDDKYILTVHDLLSAFDRMKRDSEDEPPMSTSGANELKSVVADSIKALCANGDLPDAFEDVADWVINGSMPAPAAPAQMLTDATEKWASFFDGHERMDVLDSEAEAIGEIEFSIDRDFEPGQSVQYRTAKMIGGMELLQRRGAVHLGELVVDECAEYLEEEMGFPEEPPIDIDSEDVKKLGELVLGFMAAHVVQKWWTVDQDTMQTYTYIAGSNATHAVQRLTIEDAEGGAA